MSYRIILAPLFGSDADAVVLGAAFAVSRRSEAHVVAMFVRPDPFDLVPLVGEGVSPAVIQQLTEAAEAEINHQRDAARAGFESLARAEGVAIVTAPPAPGRPSAHWVEITGRRDEIVPRRARVSDLVVFSRIEAESPTTLRPTLEATLLGAGRPVMLAPPTPPSGIGHVVAIAWNGGVEAARAVAAALPLIDAASAVHVLTAETSRTPFDVSLDLAEYLEWRGVSCARRPVAVADEPVGAALLRTAGEVGADLLVMGGYGRSRLRELLLGGVTRHVLAHAGLPVLMAH